MGCLHYFAHGAVQHCMPQAVQRLRRLLALGAGTSDVVGTHRSPLGSFLQHGRFRRYFAATPEPLPYVPELIRL